MSDPRLVKCPKCKEENPATMRVCITCAAPLSGAGSTPHMTRRFSRSATGVRAPIPLVQAIRPNNEATLWLCNEKLPPLPLNRTHLTLGRSRECDLVLPHQGISRLHVVIKTRGKVVVVEDQGSRNGTYVNGEQVKRQCVIREGDQVEVGPYAFSVRAVAEDDSLLGGLEEQQPAVLGNLRDMSIVELIQGIDFHEKTCTLEVEFEGQRGKLVVRDGVPLFAEWGDLRNEVAVLSMLDLKDGSFTLSNQVEKAKRLFGTSLKMLLFEALRQRGEDDDTIRM